MPCDFPCPVFSTGKRILVLKGSGPCPSWSLLSSQVFKNHSCLSWCLFFSLHPLPAPLYIRLCRSLLKAVGCGPELPQRTKAVRTASSHPCGDATVRFPLLALHWPGFVVPLSFLKAIREKGRTGLCLHTAGSHQDSYSCRVGI